MNLLRCLKNTGHLTLKVFETKMKLKKTVFNDILKRNEYKKSEFKLRVLRVLIRLKFIDFFDLLNIMTKIRRKFFLSNINNKCFITSRSKSVYNRIRVSRIKFKELVNNGLFRGFNKYSW